MNNNEKAMPNWIDKQTPVNASNLNSMVQGINQKGADIEVLSDAMALLNNNKFDKVMLEENTLKFYAKELVKYSITLPTGSGGSGIPGQDGQDGREIELRKSGTHIEWRYLGDSNWTQLVDLNELKGNDGAPGRDGRDGIDGVTPNLSVGTVTTLPAGSQATVTKRGTVEAPVFDFGIPQGQQGQPGGGEGGSVDLSEYQKKNDSALTTENKTVVGAINEIASDTSQNKEEIKKVQLELTDIKNQIGGNIEILEKTLDIDVNLNELLLEDDIVDCIVNVQYTKGEVTGGIPKITNLIINSDTFEPPKENYGIIWQTYKLNKEILESGSIKVTGTAETAEGLSGIFKYQLQQAGLDIIPNFNSHKFYSKYKESSDGINYVLNSTFYNGLTAPIAIINKTGIQFNQSYWFKEFLLIDLTETYGSGNEPTKEECDSIFKDIWTATTLGKNLSDSNNNFTLKSYDSLNSLIDTLDTSTEKTTLEIKNKGKISLTINDIRPISIKLNNVKYKSTSNSKPSTVSTKKIINLNNIDRLMFVGDSYTEGMYYIKGKSWTSQLSEQLDYTCDAYGWGGNTCEQIANRIIANEKRYSSLGYQDLKATKAMLMSFVNDMAQGDQYSHVYQQGMIKLIDTIRRYGAEPIVCTEFRSPWGEGLETGMSAYCNAKGIKFWNILPYTEFLNNKTASDGADERFWSGSHPGNRTGYIILDQYLRYCKTLPRPNSAIKIYRVKPNLPISTLNDLNFADRRSKLNKFKEIYISHSCLKNFTQWDSLTNNDGTAQPVVSEYSKLMNKENVSFNNYALVEVILPTTSNNVDSAKLVLSDTNISIYIKKNETFELTNNGTINNIAGCMEYDKITFLLKKEGNFIINDIYLEWEGQETFKNVDLNSNTIAKKGIELLSNNKVDNIEWLTKVGTIEPIVPTDNVLPKDCTKCIEVDNNNYIEVTSPSTNIVGAIQNNKLRVVCRYNPPVGDSSINENSYDYKELQIDIYGCNSKGTTRTYYTVKKEVGMYWTIVELEFEANDSRKIQIKSANNTKLEIAYISVLEI